MDIYCDIQKRWIIVTEFFGKKSSIGTIQPRQMKQLTQNVLLNMTEQLEKKSRRLLTNSTHFFGGLGPNLANEMDDLHS